MKKRTTAGAAIVCFLASNALAAERAGPYVGVLTGTTDISPNITSEDFYQSDEFTWGALLGWQVNRNLALEIEYFKPGGLHESVTTGADTYEVTARVHGWAATGLLNYLLNDRWSVYARVGAVRASQKFTLSRNDGALFGEGSDTATEFVYGAGLGFKIQNAQLRIEYRRAEFDFSTYGTMSLGINWHFAGGR